MREFSKVRSQIFLKCLYSALINPVSRAITKWSKVCDRRLARLISYIHDTSGYKQCCHARNTAQHCRLGLFQDSDIARDLEDSKSTLGGIYVSSGVTRSFRSVGCSKKQTSVSHCSTEAEVISLDASLRMDGIPALILWDLIMKVFHSVSRSRVAENRANQAHQRHSSKQ